MTIFPRMAVSAAAAAALTLTTPATAAIPPQMKVELIASTLSPRPGSTVLVGFRMDPKPGWHGYWSNAGGNGIAPEVRWTAPNGVTFGPLLHPAPTLFKSMGVVSYVHAGQHILVARMKVPSSVTPGATLPVRADLTWAVCSNDLCVPGGAQFSLDMIAGNGTPAADAPMLRRASDEVPRKLAGGRYWIAGNIITLAMPDLARLRPRTTHFFPDENGLFDPSQARISNAQPVEISIPGGTKIGRIDGVVTDGLSSYRVSLIRSAPPPKPEARAKADASLSPASPTAGLSAQAPTEPPLAKPKNASQAAPLPNLRLGMIIALAAAVIAGALLIKRRSRRP